MISEIGFPLVLAPATQPERFRSLLNTMQVEAIKQLIRRSNLKSVRPHLQPAKIGEITQGTVFNCIKIPRYQCAQALGLVITARCDIAQDKYPVLNYLPVVPLRLWLEQDGLRLLIVAEENSMAGKLRSALSQAGVSENLLLSVSLEEIASVHFPEDKGKKADKNRAKRFAALIKDFMEFNNLVESADGSATYRWFVEKRRKEVETLISRLSRHDVAGYYLFEHLINEDDEDAYVCLLRDVSAIPRDLAIEISNGLSLHAYEARGIKLAHDSIEISADGLAMPVSCVGSPTIEHVMQTFSSLFGRIGLDDPDGEKMTNIIARCCED